MRLIKENDNPINEEKIIDTLRGLGIDIQKSIETGSTGLTLGAATIFYTLYGQKTLTFIIETALFLIRIIHHLSMGHCS